jgi:hypothetical protein
MVWKPKKSRRSGSRGTFSSSDNGLGSRQIRSCLKVGPNEKIFVDESQTKPQGPGDLDSSNAVLDHSNKSGQSIISVISGSASSPSRDTSLSADRARSSASGGSGDSAISASRNSNEKSSQHSPFIARFPVEDKAVRFGNVSIREHERAVGDNPSCSTGPPIG